MYFASVVVLLFVLPAASVAVDTLLSPHDMNLIFSIGRWFVFWAVGVLRLFLAGVRQVLQPRFTAEEIFEIKEPKTFAIVRELGFANLSMGTLGVLTILRPDWLIAAAIVGALYYGFAGVGHLFQQQRNPKQNMAMVSDGFAFVVLLAIMVGGSRS